jgi:hypothetical protein
MEETTTTETTISTQASKRREYQRVYQRTYQRTYQREYQREYQRARYTPGCRAEGKKQYYTENKDQIEGRRRYSKVASVFRSILV